MFEEEIEMHHTVLNFEPIRMDFNPFAINLDFDWNLPKYNEGSCEDCLQILKDYTRSTEFAESYRSYVKSDLFKNDAQYNIEDFLKLDREFFIIDKIKIQEVIDNPSLASNILSQDEFEALKIQAINRNIITSDEDFNIDSIIEAANYNKEFINRIPTFDELDSKGIVDNIIELVDTDLDVDAVNVLIQNTLIDTLNKRVYIPYDLLQNILIESYNIINILTKEQFEELLYRTASSLSFLTQNLIDDILSLYDNDEIGINDLLNSEEIKLIIETELNNKSVISNMLTYDGVLEYFNTLKEQFLILNDVNFERIDITILQIEEWIDEI